VTSPFEVLGVAPDADAAEIDAAYRRRVKEVHPDQGGSVDEFQRVRAAYDAVRDGATGTAGAPTDRVGDRGSDRPSWSEDGTEEGVPGAAPAADTEDDDAAAAVEFLDYEVLADHGWTVADDDLLEKAAAAGVDSPDYGHLEAEAGDTLLEAAEACGYTWPYSCRGGACANCAVAVVDGDLSTPVDHILPEEFLERGIRLSCVGEPLTEELSVVFNVKHMPALDDLLLPPGPFAGSDSSD
jgi:curved DNA-binding protein CbpA